MPPTGNFRSALGLAGLLAACVEIPAAAAQDVPQRPVATYSIVARDSATGEIGVAVQSHWFSVGSVVPWAEAGVGAIATQSFTDPSYGALGLDLMRTGRAPLTCSAVSSPPTPTPPSARSP